jgi:hypothetical protein
METGKSLHRRLEESFSSVYLTLTSIIQGAAFSVLAVNVATQYERYNSIQWILSITTFILIILAWNEYMIGATAFVWIPWLGDTIIPFGLGVLEVFIIEAIGRDPSTWFLFAAALALWTSAAFVNMYVNASQYKRGTDSNAPNSELLKSLGWQIYFSVILCLLCFIGFGGLYALSVQGQNAPLSPESLAVIGLLLTVAFCVRAFIYWRSITGFARTRAQGSPQE